MGRPTVGRGSRVRENKGLAGGIKEIFRIGLAKITPRSSLLRCLLRLSIATSYALWAVGVALET
jgi:hypothetical protein